MLVERVTDLDRQLADPGDNRLECGDEREDVLAAGGRLELAGVSLGPASQPGQQLPGGFATRIAMPLEKRLKPLLAKTAGIDTCRVLAQERERDPADTQT